jgi:excisionase family DNA binding protein
MAFKKSKYYTTSEAAKQIGISRAALYLWIESGLIDAPQPISSRVRLWTQGDIEKAKKIKGTSKIGRPSPRKKKEGAR